MNSPGGWIYILYGDDAFSRDEQLRTLKDNLRAMPAGEHNLTELSGPDATVAGLRSVADAVPFLAERRLVVVHGLLQRLQSVDSPGRGRKRPTRQQKPDSAVDQDALEPLLAYLPLIPHTTSIAFVEGAGVDVARVRAAIPEGRAFVREYERPKDVAHWIRRRARLLELDVDESAVRELAALGGDDLRRLDNELRKLGAYANGRTITRADVQEIVVARDIVVWALLDALALRQRDDALRALRRLYAQGVAPEALLGRDVAPFFRRLLVAKEIAMLPREQRNSVDVAALGLNPRSLPRLGEQAGRFEREELERALSLLLDLDRQIKLGEIDAEAGLEVAVVRLSSRLSVAA